MTRRSTRVLLASEDPVARSILRRIVEGEDDGTIVGEAKDSPGALTLARTLRPDIALIDTSLPHPHGYHANRLSSSGGLDTAQSIYGEIPHMQVVLVRGLSGTLPPDSSWRPNDSTFLCREDRGTCVPFSVSDLGQEERSGFSLVLANVETKTNDEAPRSEGLADRMVFYGVLVSIGGWLVILTIAFAPVGVSLVFAGVLTTLLGLAVKWLRSVIVSNRVRR